MIHGGRGEVGMLTDAQKALIQGVYKCQMSRTRISTLVARRRRMIST
jgi:hypothetical protein